MNTVFQQMPAPTFSTSTRQVGERKKNKNHNSMTASNLESWWIQSQGVDLTTLLLFIFIFIFLFFFSCFTLSLSGVVMFFKLVKNALTLNSRRWCGKLSFLQLTIKWWGRWEDSSCAAVLQHRFSQMINTPSSVCCREHVDKYWLRQVLSFSLISYIASYSLSTATSPYRFFCS